MKSFNDKFSDARKHWLGASGILGVAILASKLTRIPLVTIISALPFLVKELRQAENQGSNPASAPPMARSEAALILGLQLPTSHDEVKEAYRRLIQKNHPDLGGTDYLAAKINQARDILLK